MGGVPSSPCRSGQNCDGQWARLELSTLPIDHAGVGGYQIPFDHADVGGYNGGVGGYQILEETLVDGWLLELLAMEEG